MSVILFRIVDCNDEQPHIDVNLLAKLAVITARC